MKPLLTFLFSMLAAASLRAQQDPPPADLAEPPPLPPKVQGEEVIPTVNIRTEEDRLVEEYSLNGRVYMVKITPAKGPPYYYIDEDGDGQLELQPGDDALNPVRPAYWKVKEWD
jgi:hypothetical protein